MSKKSFTSHSRNPEDVTYDDAFFINKENESITWIYFNSDSFSGGQYVTNILSFDEIRKAAQDHKSAGDFFDYLGSIANQTLADVGPNGLWKQKMLSGRHRILQIVRLKQWKN